MHNHIKGTLNEPSNCLPSNSGLTEVRVTLVGVLVAGVIVVEPVVGVDTVVKFAEDTVLYDWKEAPVVLVGRTLLALVVRVTLRGDPLLWVDTRLCNMYLVSQSYNRSCMK